MNSGGGGGNGERMDPVMDHYINAYSMTDLRTFHCEKVRKMHLSGLDPSMLLGFLCKDETDYQDFRARVLEVSVGVQLNLVFVLTRYFHSLAKDINLYFLFKPSHPIGWMILMI